MSWPNRTGKPLLPSVYIVVPCSSRGLLPRFSGLRRRHGIRSLGHWLQGELPQFPVERSAVNAFGGPGQVHDCIIEPLKAAQHVINGIACDGGRISWGGVRRAGPKWACAKSRGFGHGRLLSLLGSLAGTICPRVTCRFAAAFQP